MTPEQRAEYQHYLEILSSNASIAQTINFEKEFALKQQRIEIAKEGVLQGLTNELISVLTKLQIDEIENLRNQLNDK